MVTKKVAIDMIKVKLTKNVRDFFEDKYFVRSFVVQISTSLDTRYAMAPSMPVMVKKARILFS